MEAIGQKLELGIFRTSKPIKEEEKTKKEKKPEKSSGYESSPEKSNVVKQKPRSRTESKSPVKSPEPPKTQTLFMKNKKEKQCFADASVQKKMISREAAQKTIAIPCKPKIVKESVSFTVKIGEKKKEAARPTSPTEDNITTTTNATGSCAHQVEAKLNEIARQADELAKTIRKAAEQVSEDEQSQTTQLDAESIALDETNDEISRQTEILTVEIAPPTVKAVEELSVESPQPSPSKSQGNSASTRLTARNVATTPEVGKSEPKNTELRKLAEATKALLSFAETPQLEKSMSHSDVKLQGTRIPAVMTTSERKTTERSRESLADRLSKGIHDLTHGSTDRLQKWKTKLNSHGRRSKDQSEPPPQQRAMLSTLPATDLLLDWSPAPKTVRPLHTSKSASNALRDNVSANAAMDHRTLKSRESSASQKDLNFHYQNMNSLQKIMNAMESYTKNAQFNLPPPAKITPHSGVKPTHDDIIRPIAFRPVGNQIPDDNRRQSHDVRVERQVIRGDLAKSASNLYNISASNQQLNRPRAMFQPSTSFSPVKPQENEYDTVPEYLEKEKLSDFGSDYGSFLPAKHLSSSTASSGTTSSHLGSPPSSKKKSYPSIGSNGRSSSGVHITPSPSDSGIVDFETMIRDKENELREVRNTMEQNEEIIVKVYQEKEKMWKSELDQLRTRLAASERGEHALRAQLTGCQRQTETISRNVEGLRDEKTGLLRKCFQLERELAQLKLELDKPRTCEECKQRQKPVPAPRHIKESDASLRDEVSSLREEVSTLKDALNSQIQFFSNERKKHNENEDRSCRSESSQVNPVRDRLI